MKPSFALDFRDEQVTLLHRTARGWMPIGATRFDAPDLTEALAFMRSTALGLSPRGISTKLIIPNDQILYTTVAAPGPETAKRKRQIKAGLDGLTPYALDDLVYDWQGNGSEVQVAVVARETLEQAEAFASEHRFNPVSYVAVPDNGLYTSEPFFGPSKMSPALLSDGEKVERDSDPVFVIARDLPRPAHLDPAPVAEAAPAEPAAAEPVAAAPVVAEPEAVEPAPAVEDKAAPEPTVEPAPPSRITFAEPSPEPQSVSVELVPDELAPAELVPDEAPMAVDVSEPVIAEIPTRKVADPVTDPSLDDDLPAAPADAIRAALAARRANGTAAPSLGPAPSTVGRPAAKPVGAIDLPAKPSSGKPPKPSAPGKALKGVSAMVTAPVIPGVGRRKVAIPSAAIARPATPDGEAQPAKPTTTTNRPMVGLGGKAVPVRGKPRYLGLILTGILLVFLALAAAWSSFFLAGLSTDQATPSATAVSQNADGTTASDTAGTTDTAAADTTAADTPTAADEAAADGQDETAADTTTADAGTDAAALATSSTQSGGDVAQTADATAAATAEAAPAPAPDTGASTEGAAAPKAGETTGDEIFLAAVEPTTQLSDPVSLAQPAASGDAAPLAGPEPPPFGTVYKFDADGRIIPTPEGILTPEGVLLVAGKPKRVPPDRPAAIAALAAPVAVAAPAADAAATGASTANPGGIALTQDAAGTPLIDPAATPTAAPAPTEPDPALKGFKPKSRPANLVPAAAAPADTAAPTGPDPALAGFKPRSRASSTLAAFATAPAASASTAGLDGQAATATDGGLDTSRVPVARPAAMQAAVEAAVTAAMAAGDAAAAEAPAQQAAADPAASAEPEAQAEPDAESPAPKIPTSASVAKTATDKNALNLSKIALIGVFGPDNAHYAYVRLANGSLKKVKVGDQLDGGTVVAISASELRYQRGQKVVVLAMPRQG